MIYALPATLLLLAVHLAGAGDPPACPAEGGEECPPAHAVEVRIDAGHSGEILATTAAPGGPVPITLEWPGERPAGVGYRWISLDPDRSEPALGRRPLETMPRAPEAPGAWRLHLAGEGWERTVEAPVVLVPAPLEGRVADRLNGYLLGIWPAERSGRDGVYAPPRQLFEVTPETRDLPLSRHLRLGDFVTNDQEDVWPKYVALDFRLIDKLELVVAELWRMGARAEALHVMSGFRTPHYNEPRGSERALYSRHTYGDAADVWIDNEGRGRMSDLNEDGRIDHFDVRVIMRAVDRVEARHPELVGGAGLYVAPEGGSPWIHIDVRGRHSRW